MKRHTTLIRALLYLSISGMITIPSTAKDGAFKRIFSGRGLGRQLLEFQGRLVFTRMAGQGNEIYLSDGTEKGTRLIHATTNTVYEIGAGKGWIYFIEGNSNGGETTFELWKTGGSMGKALRVATLWQEKDYRLDTAPRFKDALITVLDGDRAMFAGWDARTRSQGCVWTSDGTAAGTKPVAFTKRGTRFLSQLARVGQQVFFDIPEDGIYLTDGAITKRVLDCERVKSMLCTTSGRLVCLAYLGARKPDAEIVMMTENGTASNLAVEKDNGPFQPQDFFLLGSNLFFMARQTGGNYKLWSVSEGEGKPRMVKNFANGENSGLVNIMGAAGRRVYCMARTPDLELGSSDGTEAGTVRLAQLLSPPNFFVTSGDQVFFDLRPKGSYFESVAASMGSAETTRVLPDSPTSGKTMGAVVIGSALFFSTGWEKVYRYDL